MKYNIDLIKPMVSFKIKEDVKFEQNVYLPIEKNNEDIVLILNNKTAYTKFCKNTFLQKQYRVLNKENKSTKILQTMSERNSNWVLLDNNLNFIQCFDDKNYNKISLESRNRFLMDKEKWGIGELEKIPLSSSKPVQTVRLIHNEDTVLRTNFKFYRRKTKLYSQRIYLHTTKEFVYIPKTYEEKGLEMNAVSNLFHSQLIYLFHRDSMTRNELHLHTVFNRSWFYK